MLILFNMFDVANADSQCCRCRISMLQTLDVIVSCCNGPCDEKFPLNIQVLSTPFCKSSPIFFLKKIHGLLSFSRLHETKVSNGEKHASHDVSLFSYEYITYTCRYRKITNSWCKFEMQIRIYDAYMENASILSLILLSEMV